MLTLPSPTTVHTRFNDNWLFVTFFCCCHYYVSLVKSFYNDLLIHLTQQAFVQSYCSTRSIAVHTLNFLEQILAG